MNIKKRSDLFREYARVVDMCEGTGVGPAQCVKIAGKVSNGHPIFYEWREGYEFYEWREGYEFAVAILEGRPLFIGDAIYNKHGELLNWSTIDISSFNPQGYTRMCPEAEFRLGVELIPVPINMGNYRSRIGGDVYFFRTEEDRNIFNDSVNRFLRNQIKEAI